MNGCTGLGHPLKGTCTWVALSEVIWLLGILVLVPPHSLIVMVFWTQSLCFTDCRAALGRSGQM